MKTKIKYQTNKNYILKKNRDGLLAKSKINQQNRKYDIKTYKQKIKDLRKKIEDLTQAVELLKTPNS